MIWKPIPIFLNMRAHAVLLSILYNLIYLAARIAAGRTQLETMNLGAFGFPSHGGPFGRCSNPSEATREIYVQVYWDHVFGELNLAHVWRDEHRFHGSDPSLTDKSKAKALFDSDLFNRLQSINPESMSQASIHHKSGNYRIEDLVDSAVLQMLIHYWRTEYTQEERAFAKAEGKTPLKPLMKPIAAKRAASQYDKAMRNHQSIIRELPQEEKDKWRAAGRRPGEYGKPHSFRLEE